MKEVFDGPGRTVADVERAKRRKTVGDPRQEAMRAEPVWHTRGEFLDPVARKLRLHRSLWGRNRESNDFYTVVDQEISKLRAGGRLADWKRGSGVFRLAGPLPAGWASAAPAPAPAVQSSDMGAAFMSILRRGAKANTYKFALARAILDHCRENGRADPRSVEALEIPYEYLAGKFLRYYWHQECKFRIKQNFKEDEEPQVVSAIRGVFGGGSPGDFSKLDRADVQRAKSLILRKVFGHDAKKTSIVVPRFQKVGRGGGTVRSGIFYECSDREQVIRLRPEAFSFFRKNDGILSGAVLAEWAKFLEKINSSLPMLIAKIERGESRRKSLISYRKEYLAHTRRCFYCQRALERGGINVDHVIPWSYMFEDDPWNLVLACPGCNCKKSDSLPEEQFLDSLIDRNASYYGTVKRVKRSLDRLDSGRGWRAQIQDHYRNCKEYGFAVQPLP